ncbi:hypothetical protein TanjilG_10490 [Lupinus angustifolius]|uniref:TF-B3 domain-containing protein n=2 Tax=Lupinus angustifolius TaxID=3871 RepID=A0A4P1R4L5_LUPAN|nr:hypothetical protein TanjilG_10490 [Lupinus angustifolius]
MIPRAFTEKYGEGLPKTIILKAPNDEEWEVNLVKHDGKIWFHKGWKEFAEYHSLEEGHFVVFKYEKSSNFEVFIFDMSALEMDYPFKRVEGKRAYNDRRDKHAMVESLEDCRPSQQRKDNSSLEFLQLNKKSRCVEVESISNLSKATLCHTGIKCEEGPHTTAKQITALDMAHSFKPSNPSFMVVMHPSYIFSRVLPSLPPKFCKRHFDFDNERREVNLRVSNGRVWPVRYVITKIKRGTKFELSRGWNAFAKDNNLKVGNVCTFELVDKRNLSFEVYISGGTDNSICSTSQEKPEIATSSKQTTALDRARNFKPCNPSFLVVMHRSYVNFRAKLNLPSKFCKRYFDMGIKNGDISLMSANGRVWPARYCIRGNCDGSKFEFRSGWKQFSEDNNLEVGDVCIFELIDRTKLAFQVCIFRVSDNSNCPASQESSDEEVKESDMNMKGM